MTQEKKSDDHWFEFDLSGLEELPVQTEAECFNLDDDISDIVSEFYGDDVPDDDS